MPRYYTNGTVKLPGIAPTASTEMLCTNQRHHQRFNIDYFICIAMIRVRFQLELETMIRTERMRCREAATILNDYYLLQDKFRFLTLSRKCLRCRIGYSHPHGLTCSINRITEYVFLSCARQLRLTAQEIDVRKRVWFPLVSFFLPYFQNDNPQGSENMLERRDRFISDASQDSFQLWFKFIH